MDIILLGITVVSLAVALVMSVAAWRLMRDEKQRSAARVAALSVARATMPLEVPPSRRWRHRACEPRRGIRLPVPSSRAGTRPTPRAGFLSASADGRDDSGGRQRSLALRR